jgi:hypothetical protein
LEARENSPRVRRIRPSARGIFLEAGPNITKRSPRENPREVDLFEGSEYFFGILVDKKIKMSISVNQYDTHSLTIGKYLRHPAPAGAGSARGFHARFAGPDARRHFGGGD